MVSAGPAPRGGDLGWPDRPRGRPPKPIRQNLCEPPSAHLTGGKTKA